MKKQVGIAITAAILGALFATSVFYTQAQATAQFKIIINRTNPNSSIKRAELAQLFLKKKIKWSHGVKAMPVDQKLTSAIRKSFSREILRKPISAVNAYWQQRIFSGRGVPPPHKSSDAAIVLYVASNAGAVGYVSVDATIGKTKVLKVTD